MTNIVKRSINIDGYNLTYVEMGDPEGRPIVFQHGNPTSSYLWRNIMPHLTEGNRCIAIDLIGMGDSQKLPDDFPDRYSFDCHSQFFEKALAALNINKNIILVIHDWGSALGFDFAARNPSRVDGIAYMEAIVAPIESWDDWPENARGIFQAFRSEAGEEVILDKNVFVERVLPGSIIRTLTTEEMDQYRKPFLNPGEDRRPTLTWPRQIPIEGSPPDVVARVQAYADFMQKSPMPKLFINADPGSILVGKMRDFC
ncbi:haloalkane dehalogenase, partial [Alphaproteobacteria bacterium]|nr:haloalkane dehalogenase [Alphaproteobacteria bacterium]